MSNLMYIGYSMTGLYPVLQSMRDDIAFDSYEHLKRGYGGYELHLFNLGYQMIAIAFTIASYLLYDIWAVAAMVVTLVICYM